MIEDDDQTIQKDEANIRLHKSLFHQMTHICREKGALRHDDRVDALAMLVAHFVELMAQDAEATATAQYEEKLRKEQDSYLAKNVVEWGVKKPTRLSFNKHV